MQRQAAALVDKESEISKLTERILQLEALQQQASNGSEHASEKASERVSQHMTSGGGEDQKSVPAWESIPAPETFKEALEQILMLQVHLHTASDMCKEDMCEAEVDALIQQVYPNHYDIRNVCAGREQPPEVQACW
jgi:hypothetical protein